MRKTKFWNLRAVALTVMAIAMTGLYSCAMGNKGKVENQASAESAKTEDSVELQSAEKPEGLSGYLITENIRVYQTKTSKTPLPETQMTRGQVAVQTSPDSKEYVFNQIDVAEDFVLRPDYVVYNPPRQDECPPTYVKRTIFNENSRKLTVYASPVNALQTGREYTFTAYNAADSWFGTTIVVTPIAIRQTGAAVAKTDYFNNRPKETSASINGKIVYEIKFPGNTDLPTCYVLSEGEELCVYQPQDSDYSEPAALYISPEGICYKKANGTTTQISKLSYMSDGSYPNICYMGWTSDGVILNSEYFLKAN